MTPIHSAARVATRNVRFLGDPIMEKKGRKDNKEVPFFTRFLERQEFPRVKSHVKAAKKPPFHTLKYPSDDDEGWPWFP